MAQHLFNCINNTVPALVNEGVGGCTLSQLNDLVNPALDAATWDEFVAALPQA